MSEVLSDFIRALRSADVRVSTSETIDAGRTVAVVGYDNRSVLKDALSQVLAKTEEEKAAFSDCFDRYFTFKSFAGSEEAPDSDAEAADRDPQAANDNSGGQPGGGGEGEASAETGEEAEAGEQSLLELLESGDAARLQMALAEAAREVNLNRIRLFTQRGLFTRRMMDAMGLQSLEDVLDRAEQDGDAGRAEQIRMLREDLRGQVRDYVEKQLELFTANSGRQLREEVLSQIRLTNVDRRDFKIMRELVRKMAKRLIALHSRRRKRAKRGHLDVRHTIRRNIEFDGLLFHTVWKQVKVDRPKIVAVCDVSGSVAQVSRFLLMFLYSLNEVLPKVRSFAFSGRLGEVTDLFNEKEIEEAITETMREHGGGSTDYGQALLDLEALALDDIDHRTTVIILGDARSNFGNPRSDVLDRIHDRARRVIWLNPEPRGLWDTGDSVMHRFRAHCDRTEVCASLRDLERVVSDLLRTGV